MDIDWSKHDLKITKSPTYHMAELKIPGSMMGRIKFTNIDGVLLVTGDYGNWVFCRKFIPSADFGGVSDGYWLEKLSIHSEQEYKDYSSEETEKELQREIAAIKRDWDDEYKRDELIEYYEECLNHTDDYYDYIIAMREIPSWADHEYYILCYETKPRLKILFDAFEEICNRMKIEETVAA